jgi:hypothetical protein
MERPGEQEEIKFLAQIKLCFRRSLSFRTQIVKLDAQWSLSKVGSTFMLGGCVGLSQGSICRGNH